MPHILSNISNFTIFTCFKDTREVYKVTLEKIKKHEGSKSGREMEGKGYVV